MDFKEFLISEKVTSKEIKDALSDKNILVGIEFEMSLDGLNSELSNGYDGYTVSELDDMYESHQKEVFAYLDEIDEARNEWTDYIISEGKDYIKLMEAEIEDLETGRKKYEDLMDDWATTNQDELQIEIDQINDDIEIRQDMIDEAKGFIRNGETYDLWEHLEENYESQVDDQYDYINSNIDYPPTMDSSLSEYYEYVMGVYVGDNWEDWILEEITDKDEFWDSYASELYPPSSYFEDSGYGNESSLEEYPNWDELPFTDYRIGSYHSGSTDASYWRIETDESLDANGVEIISPKMPIRDMLKILPKMFKFISDNGETNKKTGMHVNISYKGKNLKTDADLLKLMLFMDEGWVWKNFPERHKNHWAKSVLDDIIDNVKYGSYEGDEEIVDSVIAKYKKKIKGPKKKYFGINTSNVDSSGASRIEFRYLGGSNYHKKLKEVQTAIGRFGAYLKLAFDPKAKKKEYILKLDRLQRKFAPKGLKLKLNYKDMMFIINKGKEVNYRKEKGIRYFIYKKKKYRLETKNTGTSVIMDMYEE